VHLAEIEGDAIDEGHVPFFFAIECPFYFLKKKDRPRGSTKKKAERGRMVAKKRRSNRNDTSVESKRAKDPLPPLHSVQVNVGNRVIATRDEHLSAYLVAPPGSGKSALLRHVLMPSTEECAVLNMVCVSTADLVKEMALKMDFSLMPPFNGGKIDSLRRMFTYVEGGQTITIPVTHDFLKRKLSPLAKTPTEDVLAFVKSIGEPRVLQLIIDEAHNICGIGKWAELFKSAKESLGETEVRVVLVSGTPKLDVGRVASASRKLLGATEGAAVKKMMVAYTDEEVACFRKDLCTLPPPAAAPSVIDLAAAYPNEGMEGKVGDLLEQLAVLAVGDMLFLVECKVYGKRCRREIHSVLAQRNLVSQILTVMAHHGEGGEETGGAVFEALKKTVQTYTVRNGVTSQKPSKSGECVLVVHGAPRGLNVHANLLYGLEAGVDGVPEFSAHDLSMSDSNIAKVDKSHKHFFEAFDNRTTNMMLGEKVEVERTGHAIGLVRAKNMEGTDKYNERATKVIVIGPIDAKSALQIRGRFDRPSNIKGDMRVRKDATEIVHLRSEWAETVLGIVRLDKKAMTIIDAPDVVMEKVKALRGYESSVLEFICKLACKLHIAEGGGDTSSALLPGRLLDLFFSHLADNEARGSFLSKSGGGDGYWSVVRKYARDDPCDDEDASSEEEKAEVDEAEEEEEELS